MKTDHRRSCLLATMLGVPVLRWSCRAVSVGIGTIQLVTCHAWLVAMVSVSAGPTPTAWTAPVAEPSPSTAEFVAPEASAAPPDFSVQKTAVNRNVPVDLPVRSQPAFSAAPTTEEIRTKGGLLEPLVPVGDTKPSAAEDKALADALTAYHIDKKINPEDVSALTGFLASYPNSSWRAALLTNLGLIYRQTGYFSRALAAWEEAWRLASNDKQGSSVDLADRALSELAELNARLGRQDRIKDLLSESAKRQLKGSVANRLDRAKGGLWLMQNQPSIAFKCGPFALGRILASQNAFTGTKALMIHEAQSTVQGTSLTQVAQLSHTLGMNYRMAKRQPGSTVIVPAVVHWKAGHFAALVRQLGNGKYWMEDPTFGNGIQVSQTALDEEATGYFLVPADHPLPLGWQRVQAEEGQTIWGKGAVTQQDPICTTCHDQQTGGNGPSCGAGCAGDPSGGAPSSDSPAYAMQESSNLGAPNIGMPGYTVHTMLVSMHITDTPVGYAPPLGPSVYNTVTYNQYESNQLAGSGYPNFGPLWNFEWLSYIVFDTSLNASVHIPGGGTVTYIYVPPSPPLHPNGTYESNVRDLSTLQAVAGIGYVQQFRNGSKIVYNVSDASGNVFLKQQIDPQNNAVTLHYAVEADADAAFPMQLTSISDAMGQTTQFTYGLPGDDSNDQYKITKITDPFGRFASFGYTMNNGAYQLTSITDVIGMSSLFTYQGNNITLMTTPYGTTTFTSSTLPSNASVRVLEVADPLGATERWESWMAGAPIDNSESIPAGIATVDGYLSNRNTFYWNKKAMLVDPTHPYTNATIYHFLHTSDGSAESPTLESVKKPLENRVWFNYPGQSVAFYEGTLDQPSAVGRILDDNTTQLQRFTYNSVGNMTESVGAALDNSNNPVNGRTTFYDYDTSGIDLLMTRQATSPSTSVGLEKRVYDSSYPPHMPKQIIDASGQLTSYTYDNHGRVLTTINAKNEATTNSYTCPANAGPSDGYLYSVTGAVPGATTNYTYDAAGRRITSTDSEGYQLRFDYDALNRLVRTTYADAPDRANCTYAQTIYNRLDPEWKCDRQGRWTHLLHNSVRQLVSVRDPMNRVTNYGYCLCGSLTSLTDSAGNETQWTQDLQGRESSKTYADGSQTVYHYEQTTSRLKSVIDAIGNVVAYNYCVDNKLAQISYTGPGPITPTVSLNYDPTFDRLSSERDGTDNTTGTGETTYNYGDYFVYSSYSAWPSAVTEGAGQLRIEQKNGNIGFASYTVNYGYDELGRQTSRSIDGTSNQSAASYDSLGRIRSITNLLSGSSSAFNYDYTTATSLDVSLVYLGTRNGLRTSYGYYPNNGDCRLQTINNQAPSGSTISRFDYNYNTVGDIITWTQQSDSQSPQTYIMGYDLADQLTSATLEDNTPPPNQKILKTYAYNYDLAANRTTEQIDLGITTVTPNNLNQMANIAAGGRAQFSGTISKAATVTVGGIPAQVSGNGFVGYASVIPGVNDVAVSATGLNGQTTTNNYQIQVGTGGHQTLVYDVDGNLISDGASKTYEWDAANRLVAINYTGSNNRTEFAYDGQGRRVQIVEKTGGNINSVKAFVWCGNDPAPCEERDGYNNVTARFFAQGEQIGGLNCYASRDHLNSLRELTDVSGVVRARYSYDPYGRRTKIKGDLESSFGFTGHYFHSPSNLHMTLYRAYNAQVGRWLSRDPKGESAGVNIYDYLDNCPIRGIDLFGLDGSGTITGTDLGGEIAIKCRSKTCSNVQMVQIINDHNPGSPWRPDGRGNAPTWPTFPYYQGQKHDGSYTDTPQMFPYNKPVAPGRTYDYETCAICLDTGTPVVMGCYSWSASYNGKGKGISIHPTGPSWNPPSPAWNNVPGIPHAK